MNHPRLVIVGAGPAGVSAALWARSQNLSPRLIEAGPKPGGQLQHVHFHPGELPGIEVGDGPAIAATYARQLEQAGVEAHYDSAAISLVASADRVVVETAAGSAFDCDALLVACGVRRRRLGVAGEDTLEGHGVSFSASLDRDRFAGHPVVVVGGGDAAFENALMLSAVGCQVMLAVRDTPRARAEFRERVADDARIEVCEGTRVLAFEGDGALERVRFETRRGAIERAAAGAVIKVGMIPNTEWCAAAIECDPAGYLRVDQRFRSGCERVWAAGDVTGPALPAIAVSIGQAAVAVGDIRDSVSRARS